jgi:uncharacterized protein YuzE
LYRTPTVASSPHPASQDRHTGNGDGGYAVVGSRLSVLGCRFSVVGSRLAVGGWRLQTRDTPCLWRISAIRAWDNCEPTTKKPKTGTFDPPSGAKIPTGFPVSMKKPRKAIPCSASLSYHQAMKDYHRDTDSLYIDLSSKPSIESREITEGIVLDYDADGNLVGIDIDNASRKVDLKEVILNKVPAEIQTVTA